MSDYSCCIYRSKDPVRNFKIRVILSKATGRTGDSSRNNELAELLKNAINSEGDDREEVVINWQTKIFSKSEFLKYSSSSFEATSILEENYKDECLKLK